MIKIYSRRRDDKYIVYGSVDYVNMGSDKSLSPLSGQPFLEPVLTYCKLES